VSTDRAHMSKIGRLGGKSSAGRRGSQSTAETEAGAPVESKEPPRMAESVESTTHAPTQQPGQGE
jgi:general stress protein YciG